MSKFDIIEFISSLTGFVFDKAVLKRIALERQVYDATDFNQLSKQDIDLMRADLLLTAYLSPNVIASNTQAHGSYSQTIGSQTIYSEDKEKLYNIFYGIYKRYNDDKLSEVEGLDGTLEWLEC